MNAMQHLWTPVASGTSSAGDSTTYRMAVPGGVLYRELIRGPSGELAVAICFVPDTP
jgi:hypothetical protein